jgi:hypothetical protein
VLVDSGGRLVQLRGELAHGDLWLRFHFSLEPLIVEGAGPATSRKILDTEVAGSEPREPRLDGPLAHDLLAVDLVHLFCGGVQAETFVEQVQQRVAVSDRQMHLG